MKNSNYLLLKDSVWVDEYEHRPDVPYVKELILYFRKNKMLELDKRCKEYKQLLKDKPAAGYYLRSDVEVK